MASSGDLREEDCHPAQKLFMPTETAYKPYPVQPKIDVTDPLYNQYENQRLARQQASREAEDSSKFDIKKATQHGNYERVKELIESGEDVNSLDQDGVSLLHWAAINNRQEIARLLVERGSRIDVFGGALNSTPLHWATRQGHLDMVVYLISLNADPLSFDSEGYHCLHLAAMFSHSSIVAYLIARGIDVDSPDKNGMTALMWACYRTASVDPTRLLLTLGADVNRKDNLHSNQALHWAVTAGNHSGLNQLILRKEIDLQALNAQGQTALDITKSRKNKWLENRLINQRRERGLDRTASYIERHTTDNPAFRLRAMVAFPFFALGAIGGVFELDVSWILRLVLLALLYPAAQVFKNYLADERLGNTIPFGLYLATKFWMYFTWFFYAFPYIESPVIHLMFLINTALIMYHFGLSVKKDPGFILPSREQQIQTILNLAETKKIKLEQFCSTCLIHKPLRSKHCSICDKCVAKFDHHCPWIFNCVGLKNMHHFILYLTFLIGMILWCFYGCIIYYMAHHALLFDGIPKLSTKIYNAITYSPWVAWISLNCCFHVVFVGILLSNILYQAVYLGLTTNERINLFRYQHFKRDGKFHNPYHRGIMGNCADEVQIPCPATKMSTIDWMTITDIEIIDQPRSDSQHIV